MAAGSNNAAAVYAFFSAPIVGGIITVLIWAKKSAPCSGQTPSGTCLQWGGTTYQSASAFYAVGSGIGLAIGIVLAIAISLYAPSQNKPPAES